MSKERYAAAGVDVEAAERLVERYAPYLARTQQPGTSARLGGFASMLDPSRMAGINPEDKLVWLSSVDGVGTKIALAVELGEHGGIGADCVAMCANDVLAAGAKPVAFMNYIGCERLSALPIEALMEGMSQACVEQGCALLGGETAELPGTYADERGYELVGFCLGVAAPEALFEETVQPGDWLLSAASSGVHSNGLSLIRAGAQSGELSWSEALSSGETLGAELLRPTRQYGELWRQWRSITAGQPARRAAHVTGGGLVRAVRRVFTESEVDVQATLSAIEMRLKEPEALGHVRRAMGLSWRQGAEVWNAGAGMLWAVEGGVERAQVERWCEALSRELGYEVRVLA